METLKVMKSFVKILPLPMCQVVRFGRQDADSADVIDGLMDFLSPRLGQDKSIELVDLS